MLLKNAKLLQNILEEKGFKTLAAGGFVRDHLLKREPKDIDLATEATPDQVISILNEKNIRVEETGLKHGTVSAILDSTPFEITTLRVDKVCHGREAEVEFIKSFEEDAKRRDFTVNALFMNLNDMSIIDYVGGTRDLEDKKLRFVGDSEQRIKEDYLRILRLFRFSSQLVFDMESNSVKAALRYLPYMMAYISTERILSEMSKLIVGDGVLHILKDYPELIFNVFPEMYITHNFKQKNKYHCHDVYTHSVIGVDYLKKFKDPNLSFAHLLHDVAKPLCHTTKWEDGFGYVDHFYDHDIHGVKVAQRICHRLKFSSEDTKRISFLIENHMRLHFANSKKAIRKLVHHCEGEAVWDLLKILEADISGQVNKDVDFKEIASQIREGLDFFKKPHKISNPLSGFIIMNDLGVKYGPNVGRVKDFLVEQILEHGLDPDDITKLTEIATIFIKENNLT